MMQAQQESGDAFGGPDAMARAQQLMLGAQTENNIMPHMARRQLPRLQMDSEFAPRYSHVPPSSRR